MSISEFTAMMQNQAYKNWFKASGKNLAKQMVTELREIEEKSNRNAFHITIDTIKDVIFKLTSREPTENEVHGVLNNLKSVKLGRSGREPVVIEEDNSLFFPGINFDKISSIIKTGFKDIATDKKVSDFFQRGHVYGIPTQVGKRTLENIAVSSIPPEMKEKLLLMLGELIHELERQDEATSNLTQSSSLYASYRKKTTKYLIELQLVKVNQEAGLDVAPITNAIRRYFDPKNYVAIAKNLKTRPQDEFIKHIIESHGSPSYQELLVAAIVDTIQGKKISTKEYVVPKTEILKVTNKFVANKYKKQLKDTKSKLTLLHNKISRLPTTIPAPSNLSSLEALLRSRLALQIKENMGTGSAKNVLNYRTGRFAETATIERATISRAGMVSVFYNYMRNPYGTFSDGGRQQYPKSRDPKLLISKSIREIGSSAAYNRMRAVLV
jgi:hypothetical protein